MPISRRNLLHGGVVAAAAVSSPRLAESVAQAAPTPVLTKFRDALQIPTFVDGSKPITLTAVRGTHQFHSQLGSAQTLGYQLTSGTVIAAGTTTGAYLGPTIVVPTDTTTSLTTINTISGHPLAGSIDTAVHGAVAADRTSPRIATHLHGGNSTVASDGGPMDTFVPGNRRTYTYQNSQDAAGL
jgi:hypothetical protein